MDVEHYAGLITDRNYRREKFMEYVRMLIRQAVETQGIACDIPYAFNIENASGNQLDIIGTYVGVSRQFPVPIALGNRRFMDDEVYRIAILAKIMQNQWDGKNESFVDIWNSTIGNIIELEYKDNQDMTISINMKGTLDPQLIEMILREYIVPKPAGVGMLVELTETVDAEPVYGGAKEYDVSATILIPNNINEDPESQDTVYAGAEILSDDARIRIPYGEKDQKDREAATECYAGAEILTEDARIHIPFGEKEQKDREATEECYAGAAFTFLHSSIFIPVGQSDWQGADAFFAGAGILSNDARYSVSINE